MKFGQFNLMTVPGPDSSLTRIVTDTAELVRLAEQLDFDTAWFAEHHFSNYSMCPSPLMMAAYCAPITERIRLGPAVLVLPLYHPVRLVEELALLDVQSGGRLVLGFGSGYQPFEFEGFGHDIEGKLDMMHELWDIVEMGLTRGEIAYQGKHFNLPRRPLVLRPAQSDLPEVFVAGTNPSLVERVAKNGHTPFISAGVRGLDKLEDLRRQVEQGFRNAGRDPARIPLGVQRYIYVTDRRDDALDAARCAQFVGRTVFNMIAGTPKLHGAFLETRPFEGEPTLEEIIENVHIGDPETVAAGIAEEVRRVRPTHYNCFFCFGPMEGARALRSVERFGAEVMPLLERELGPLDAVNEVPVEPAAAAGD